jgi:hypothetical protein
VFPQTDRFTLEQRIGAGGFGDVYRAYDAVRGTPVALKVLRQITPESLYQFKQEFRRLAGAAHPNLVQLHELHSVDDQWFFTMELVTGRTLLDYVRAHEPDANALPAPSEEATDADAALPPAGARTVAPLVAPRRAALGVDLNVLREVFSQLVDGIEALHDRGLLHRDLKPSNVLVTPEGRVVILDFGLATDAMTVDATQTQHMGGTPVYMAPEQATSSALTPAADWYAVGVMLYELLAQRWPFMGTKIEVLTQKMQETPPAVRTWVDGVPHELATLVDDLLRPAPADRPALEAIRRVFPRHAWAKAPAGAAPPVLVGRTAHLEFLHAACDALDRGVPVIVHVHGRSGIGKTALVRHFLADLRRRDRDGTVILAGRCYEQETVRYKGLDSLIDSLSRYLRGLPDNAVDALLPRDVPALARAFPVLERVEPIANAPRRATDTPEPQELRRRAAAALRELLARLSDRRRVVLSIDDLQWGDADSATLMQEVLHPPDAPPLLLIASYRREEQPRSDVLRRLLALRAAESFDMRELAVDELSIDGARELAERLLLPDARPAAAAIARESSGNPLFVRELVDFVHLDPDAVRRGLSLSEVIRTRAAHLPPPVRRALEVVAVAGQPIDSELMRRAAGSDSGYDIVEQLRRENFIRHTKVGERSMIEAAHDRVREAVLEWLPEDARVELHVRLAAELERSGSVDPELLALHYRAGGDRRKAAEYSVDAAHAAARALAFERAVALYQQALALSDGPSEDLRVALGDALVNAGRGAEAAEIYLSAVPRVWGRRRLELQRRAAEQLLRSGKVDEGLSTLEAVARAVGMDFPRRSTGALIRLLWGRARIRLRGLSYTERAAEQIAPERLLRIDVCWSAAVGLSMIDTIYGRDFQARHLMLALQAGEPRRIARALAMEVAHAAIGGTRSAKRAHYVLQITTDLVARIGTPEEAGRLKTMSAAAAWLVGDWKQCHERAVAAERQLREQCSGVAWELGTAQIFSLAALAWMGRLAELATLLPKRIREARARGDLYTEASLVLLVYSHMLHLARSDPAEADRQITRYLNMWSMRGFHLQHLWAVYGRADIALFEGDFLNANRIVEQQWRDIERSMLLRAQTIRMIILHLRGKCAAAAASVAGGTEQAGLLRRAGQAADDIRRARAPWAKGFEMLLRAQIARIVDPARVAPILDIAERELRSRSMDLWASAAQWHRGHAILGEEGARLIREAEAFMRAQGIVDGPRIARMLIPGHEPAARR